MIWSFWGKPRPVILVKESDPPTRQRFGIAHELGHWIRNDHNGLMAARGPLSEADAHRERWCNTFAGALLIPQRELGQQLQAGRSIGQMASTFGVSPRAVRHEMRALSLIGLTAGSLRAITTMDRICVQDARGDVS